MCLSGEIFDVVVDLRKKSKTFKKFITIRLTENNSLAYIYLMVLLMAFKL